MIKKFKGRVLSLILAVSLAVGSFILPFGIFAAEVTPAETTLMLNRDFEDKTSVSNGFGATQTAGNTIKLVTEDGNTFMRWVFDTTATGTTHGHFNIEISNYLPDEGSVVLRAKVRTTDTSSTTRTAILARPYDYHHGASIQKPDGSFYGYNSGMNGLLSFSRKSSGASYVPSLKLLTGSAGYSAAEFVEVAYVFSWTDKTDVTVNAYYDGASSPSETCTMKSYGVDARPCYFRFQVNTGKNLSWDLDDLQIYIAYTNNDASALAASFDSNNRGVLYNASADAYIDPDAYVGHHFFKVNVDKALDKNGTTVYTLSQKPFSDENGKIWFPVSALEAVVGEVSANAPVSTVKGIECVRMEDISLALDGYYASYHSSGLVAISEKQEVFVEGASDESVIPVMQKFLFDNVNTSLEKVEAFSVSDGQYLNHPYIFANQDKFDSLRETYLDADGTADQTLKGYIQNRVSSAESIYKSYAITSNGEYSSLDSGKGLSGAQKNIYEMPYLDAQGYDIGGRHSQATSHASRIQELAFAWQITREDRFALLAYDYAIAIGGWEHWGPGHFLNCADAAGPYSTAYDWLYPAWVELGLDVSKIEEIIFTHAVVPGYYSRSANTIPEGWMRYISGVLTKSGWGFNGTNNWNAVCSAGMVTASLAIAGLTTATAEIYVDTDVNGVAFEKTALVTDLGSHAGLSTYRDYSEWLINECLYGMAINGLVQYIPDGSYIESSGYWSYGTNNFFEMVAALTTATEYNTGVSNDFGMLDAWGIDRTCYYALNTQSGDFKTFNYHDSSSGVQDTSWFGFYGNYTGKTDLAAIRIDALASGKSGSPTVQDILFYVKPVGEYEKPALQYWWEGINGYVVRDSWESGSIYAGIMGDTNNLGHGQIDSGSFVYHNGGTVWFCDIGTENYNCYGFWGSATRYRYYKMNAEGNNTLFLANRSSVPYGQALNGFGKIIATGDNAYGAYTVMDNTTAYGGYARSAYRGMLLTNDRRTLVIQDEVEFLTAETAYWVGHTEQEVILSVDKTAAYMYDGRTVIRVSIIDMSNSGAHFVIEDCYTYHLEASEGMDEIAYEYYVAGTHELNNDRSQYKKLTIALDGVKSVKLAVVIEEVAVGQISELGYEWQDMLLWNENTPSSDGSVSEQQTALHTGDGSAIGAITVKGTDANLSLSTDTLGMNTVYLISAARGSGATSVSFGSKASLTEFGFLGDRTIVAELDLGTLGKFPENARVALSGAGKELIGIDLSELGTLASTVLKRITLVIDGQRGKCYVFFGDTAVLDAEWKGGSVEDLAIVISSRAGALDGESIVLDNLSLRTFGSDYSELSDLLVNGNIADWELRLPINGASAIPVARITYKNENPFDTPVIDLIAGASASYAVNTERQGVAELYSWEEVEALLVEGATLEVLVSNYHYPIEIDCPLTVNTHGNDFFATSSSYMAFVDGEAVEYRKGSVTVTFITDSGTFTQTHTASRPASFFGMLDKTVYERKTDVGYEYYVKDGWALTSGGEALTSLEMTVTSENCVFYQAEKPYEAAFVTVKDGVVSGYTDSDKLFTYATSGGFDRISLTSDIFFDSTNLSCSWSGTVNIYLNGYTLTYVSEKTSDHMYSHKASVSIYGPGKMVNNSLSSNLFLATGGTVNVNGVTVESASAVTDHRGGVITFTDCDITITKNGVSAFAVRNRNNAETQILPTLNIVGCTLNLPYLTASKSVFCVSQNSVLSVTDTKIKASTGGYLLSLQNDTVGSVAGFDYDNAFEKMQVKLGNVIHDCVNLVICKSNAPSGYAYPEMVEKIGYISGAALGWEDAEVWTYDGCVVARQNDSANPYVVTAADNTVSVTWRVGDESFTEIWVKGSIPNTESPTLSALLSCAAEGRKYVFSLGSVDTDTVLTAEEVTDFPVSVNLTLHTGFTVNVFLQVTKGVSFNGFSVDGVEYNGVSCTMPDGTECVKLAIRRDNPATAAELINLIVSFDDENVGVVNKSLVINVSLGAYVEKILSSDYSEESKGLVANVLKYVKNAYEYEGNELLAGYSSVLTLSERFEKYMTASVVRRESTDLSEISHAVSSAALYLENSPAFRFYVRDGYNGNITLSYATLADGSTVSRTFTPESFVTEVAEGETRRYVNLTMRAFDFATPITVTVEGEGGSVSASYSLAMYYHSVACEIGPLTEFINAIYAYAESARLYRGYSDENGLK
ncbi:MAG: heparinase II/III family protein [Clostridia bacterium]|nr:heparinase II/III family protein [Clostridia bacterium]